MMICAYEYFRSTPPFRGWSLPESDEVEFHVIEHTDRYADAEWRVGHLPILRISRRMVRGTPELMGAMAHELIHLRLLPEDGSHGDEFLRLARQVCRIHGFNPEGF
jgi:hypothetical protein